VCDVNFLFPLAVVFGGLFVCALLTRLVFAFSERIAYAPLLDIVISLFTWLPWVAGYALGGWWGVLGAACAQVLGIHTFCIIHRLIRGKNGRTLTAAQGVVLGPIRNQLCLLIQTPAVVAFVGVRFVEIFLYPLIAALGKLPTYRHSEWVNLSRHKYAGLIGYDLLWCWYCDWMTGLWALGSDMLRNIESFWCPIQFCDETKNRNAVLDFPDLAHWAPADGTMEDAVKAFEKHYDGIAKNSWWGHPGRNPDNNHPDAGK
jgi:hypothetical protein